MKRWDKTTAENNYHLHKFSMSRSNHFSDSKFFFCELLDKQVK